MRRHRLELVSTVGQPGGRSAGRSVKHSKYVRATLPRKNKQPRKAISCRTVAGGKAGQASPGRFPKHTHTSRTIEGLSPSSSNSVTTGLGEMH